MDDDVFHRSRKLRADALVDEDLDDDPFADGTARSPVHVVGRVIARSPVGAWWCAFIDECGSPGRAERGQAYVRAGALLDLKVRPGCITAELDAGVRRRPVVTVPLPPPGSLRLDSSATGRDDLQRTLPRLDLLPVAEDLLGSCGCADRVPLCEHLLAALYGFAARLDAEPELLLLLRGVEVAASPVPKGLVIAPLAPEKIALTGSLSALFGLNLRDEPLPWSPNSEDPEPPSGPSEAVAVESRVDDGIDTGPALNAEGGVVARSDDPGSTHGEEIPEPAEPAAEVRRDYLKFIGIRSRTIDIWVREGVLLPTDRFHVYLRTPEANRRIAQKLAR